MTVLPNIGLILPTRGAAGSGQWHDALDAQASLLDDHDHSSGKGKRINSDAIAIDADLTMAGFGLTNLDRAAFAAITALTSGQRACFFDTSGDFYIRNGSGTNVRITNGSSLNVAAFVGGIGGDYSAVVAALNYDDSNARYTFKGAAGTNWARLASGEVQIRETGTSESLYVGIAAPTGLASSYAVTMPTALPGSTQILQVASSGQVSFSNTISQAVTFSGVATADALITANAGVTCAANQHVTVSGTGAFKHGDRTLGFHAWAGLFSANWLENGSGYLVSLANTTLMVPIPLHSGDRAKSVSFKLYGDGAADITTSVYHVSAAMATTQLGQAITTNPAASWQTVTINITDTTLADLECFYIEFAANAANIRLGNISVTYDRP